MPRVVVTALGAQGDGVVLYEGQPVYVDNVLPDEIVDIDIDKTGKRGQLKSLIIPSPIRDIPPCRHFEICGGCTLQHMRRMDYQSWKYNSVKSYLNSKNIIPNHWDDPVYISEKTRRRADFALLKRGKKLIIGFHEKRSRIIVEIQECHVLDPDVTKARDEISQELPAFIPDNAKGSVFIQKTDNGLDVVLTSKIGAKNKPDLNTLEAIARLVHSTKIIRFSWRLTERDIPEILIEQEKPMVKFGSLSVSPKPLAFLQPSMAGQAALIQILNNYMADDVRCAADLFSGCGTFTGALMARNIKVDAFEGGRAATDALKESGQKSVFQRNLFKDPLTPDELNIYDAVIIDPPRAGAMAQMEQLAQSKLKTIISISCNPATFARDAAILIEGGYILESATMVDQFIWSAHVELVGKFTRQS